jgi:hypothetical protein
MQAGYITRHPLAFIAHFLNKEYCLEGSLALLISQLVGRAFFLCQPSTDNLLAKSPILFEE